MLQGSFFLIFSLIFFLTFFFIICCFNSNIGVFLLLLFLLFLLVVIVVIIAVYVKIWQRQNRQRREVSKLLEGSINSSKYVVGVHLQEGRSWPAAPGLSLEV